MTEPLLYWTCPTCARPYGSDVEKCPAPKCGGGPSREDQARFLIDTFRGAGCVREVIWLAHATAMPPANRRQAMEEWFARMLDKVAPIDANEVTEATPCRP